MRRISRAQIIATLGDTSNGEEMLSAMIENGLDIIRLNMSWGTIEEHKKHITIVRKISKKLDLKIPIIIDLPGPRLQTGRGHSYDKEVKFEITKKDEEFLKFGIKNNVDYFALSFVGTAEDVTLYTRRVDELSGGQKLIAKIERNDAVNNFDRILEVSDAIMVARGDLSKEIPMEQIPFLQSEIIRKTNESHKPVIVATEMLYSMVNSPEPTRAEVTDVTNAILSGADALMLSDETAIGKYPDLAVCVMDKIILESEMHTDSNKILNKL